MATVLLVACLWSHLWLECSHDLGPRSGFCSKKVPHKATGKLRRLGRVNNVHGSSIMLICHHNLLVFLAILLRVVQAGSSDSLNSTDGDRLVLSFEAVANLIWKSAHAIFLPQFGICTGNHQKKPLIFTSTSWLMMRAHERWGQAENLCCPDESKPERFHICPCPSNAWLQAWPCKNMEKPIEGEGGGGQNQPVEFHVLCLETLG